MIRLQRIAPELPAPNLQKAVQYYEHNLGFKVVTQMSDDDYAVIERDCIAIHLFQDNSGKHSPIGIHVFTPDLDALFAELEKLGACLTQGIQRKPWGNREFRVRDEFGNEIKFTEPLVEE